MQIGPPSSLGLPAKFQSWRKGQVRAVWDICCQPPGYFMQIAPTGVGKSLIYVAGTRVRGGRTAILTSTKGLQDQLMDDFASVGMAEVRGRGNYDCKLTGGTARYGLCRYGYRCRFRESSCQYYEAIRAANKADVFVTNYAFWLLTDALEPVDNLILDEAHNTYDQLSGYCTATIDFAELSRLTEKEIRQEDMDSVLAAQLYNEMGDKVIEAIKGGTKLDEYVHRLSVVREEVHSLCRILKQRVATEEVEGGVIRYAALNVADYLPLLLRSTPFVLLTSATVNEYSAKLLGMDDIDVMEYPSPFPVVNRPVYAADGVYVDRKITADNLKKWAMLIDKVTRARIDRKGIVHTVSYRLQRDYQKLTKLKGVRLITPKTQWVAKAVKSFKEADPPALLVSPSVTTGYDFPGDQCRFQVIGKVPFPNMSSPIERAREKEFPELPMYHAWQEIVQAAGRGVRSEDDWCETIVMDKHFRWMLRDYKQFAPEWFLSSVKVAGILPKARR